MNPARKKVPYPICGISCIQQYLFQCVSDEIIEIQSPEVRTPSPNSHMIQKELFEPLTTTREVKSVYQQSGSFTEKNNDLNDNDLSFPPKLNEQMHFQILDLIKENTKLIKLLSGFDLEIGFIKQKLRDLEQEYMDIVFAKARRSEQDQPDTLRVWDNQATLKRKYQLNLMSDQLMEGLIGMKRRLKGIQLEKFIRNKEHQ